MVALSLKTIRGGHPRQQVREINPLLGGVEAAGFGVGRGHEEPTPALRATPPRRGFAGRHQIHMQNSGRQTEETEWAWFALQWGLFLAGSRIMFRFSVATSKLRFPGKAGLQKLLRLLNF